MVRGDERGGAGMRNRYAGGCSWCSVWVYAEGGFLSGDSDSGWKIECATCHWLLEALTDGRQLPCDRLAVHVHHPLHSVIAV